jgi:hypothetical protein
MKPIGYAYDLMTVMGDLITDQLKTTEPTESEWISNIRPLAVLRSRMTDDEIYKIICDNPPHGHLDLYDFARRIQAFLQGAA